jgi:flagellar basal-body rod modification protein FlgD
MISSTTATDTGSWIPGERDKLAQPADPLANKETFLNLLVAQLKYQNPMNPADGMQFVTQLAQFSQLEQSMTMTQDLDAIRTTIQNQATATTGAAEGSGAST